MSLLDVEPLVLDEEALAPPCESACQGANAAVWWLKIWPHQCEPDDEIQVVLVCDPCNDKLHDETSTIRCSVCKEWVRSLPQIIDEGRI